MHASFLGGGVGLFESMLLMFFIAMLLVVLTVFTIELQESTSSNLHLLFSPYFHLAWLSFKGLGAGLPSMHFNSGQIFRFLDVRWWRGILPPSKLL